MLLSGSPYWTLSELLYEQGNRKCISEVGRSNWGLLRKKIDRTSVEEVLPMLLSGSPNVCQLEPNNPRYAKHL